MRTASPSPLAVWRHAGRIAVLAVLAASIVLAWQHRLALDPDSLSRAIAAWPAAPAAFLAVQVVASLCFFPRTVLAMAAGLVFGMGWGLVWAASGSVLGAIAGFAVARYVNGGLIEPESMPRLGPLLQRAEAGGWRAVMALRLIPVVPHSLANYALGLTRLKFSSYVLGSFLGQLPMTLAYVDLGAAGGRLWQGGTSWIMPTLVGFAALAVSLLLPRFARRLG